MLAPEEEDEAQQNPSHAIILGGGVRRRLKDEMNEMEHQKYVVVTTVCTQIDANNNKTLTPFIDVLVLTLTLTVLSSPLGTIFHGLSRRRRREGGIETSNAAARTKNVVDLFLSERC